MDKRSFWSGSHTEMRSRKKFPETLVTGNSPVHQRANLKAGIHLRIPNLSPWPFDMIILDVSPSGLRVSIEDSHNCASVWQHRINLLCCQGERLLFLMAVRKLVMKHQESLKRVSIPWKSSQWLQKHGRYLQLIRIWNLWGLGSCVCLGWMCGRLHRTCSWFASL